jgi:hypothetical protein
MATPESTTIPCAPPLARAIQFDRTTRDYTLYLDGEPVGCACSYHQGELTLDALVSEILAQYVAVQVEAVPAQPLPPLDAVADTLDEQARLAADPAPFTEARAQLDSGIPIVADGPALWIDDCLVLPNPSRVGWPWSCPCGQAQCWHGALAEALTLTQERQAELVGGPLPFEV